MIFLLMILKLMKHELYLRKVAGCLMLGENLVKKGY
jgi:hypothetical protein